MPPPQTLKPSGTEEVVQKGEMEKNNNNTNYEKSVAGEKVGEGEPTEEITKDPVERNRTLWR